MSDRMYVIPNKELMEAKWYMGEGQTLLHLMKEKGAPVLGTIWLSADLKNYKWTRYDDLSNEYESEITIKVEKLPTPSSKSHKKTFLLSFLSRL